MNFLVDDPSRLVHASSPSEYVGMVCILSHQSHFCETGRKSEN
jgi:hypothetical protein